MEDKTGTPEDSITYEDLGGEDAKFEDRSTTARVQLTNVVDTARALRDYGVTNAWLKKEATEGRIPCLRIGKKILFSVDAVETSLIQRATSVAPSRGEEELHAAFVGLGSNGTRPRG